MALIRTLLIITFDENDTFNEKQAMRKMFESKGYNMIAETKIDRTGVVKEWIMQSPVTLGKFDLSSRPEPATDPKKIFMFNPKGIDG